MDVGELRETYRRFAPVVYRRALRLVRDEADAWDVVHEVFRKLIESRAEFRREARPMTYIYRVTTNLALNHLRSRSVRERIREPQTAEQGGEAQAVEARELIVRLLDELDERAIQIACLHFFDELTQDEIGEVVGLSRKTVGKELARIRELAQKLGSEQRQSP